MSRSSDFDKHQSTKKTKSRAVPLRRRQTSRKTAGDSDPNRLHLYGLHAVRSALLNDERQKIALFATTNALSRLGDVVPPSLQAEIVEPRHLDQLLGPSAVHQGVALTVEPLEAEQLDELGYQSCIVLDQVTDPHNVGAIMRSAAAFGFEAVITTARHSAPETATLAKSASGALDVVKLVRVSNLSKSLHALRGSEMIALGLDSGVKTDLGTELSKRSGEASQPLRLALVLGSEGRGLREKTREACDELCSIPYITGDWYSLNVSNAAAVAMYAVKNALHRP